MITLGHKTVYDYEQDPGKYCHYAETKEIYCSVVSDDLASYDLYHYFTDKKDEKQAEYWSKQDNVPAMLENDRNFVYEA